MQYLLLCCINEKEWNALPASQRDDVMQDYGDWVKVAAKSG